MKRPGPFEQAIFALLFFLGFLVAQDRLATGTWAWCNLSQTYACHVWMTVYRGGGTE